MLKPPPEGGGFNPTLAETIKEVTDIIISHIDNYVQF